MKKNRTLWFTIALGMISLFSCTLAKDKSAPAATPRPLMYDTGNPADTVGTPGVPGATVPTGPAMILRITNALENNANPLTGNFASAITKFSSNLPKLPNPFKATGADQASLLAYAACADVPASTYSVNINQSITLQKANIIAAGKRILDRCTAGLASTNTGSAEVIAALSELVDKNALVAGETTEMAWISSCYASVTVCTQFLGM